MQEKMTNCLIDSKKPNADEDTSTQSILDNLLYITTLYTYTQLYNKTQSCSQSQFPRLYQAISVYYHQTFNTIRTICFSYTYTDLSVRSMN